MFCLLKVVEPLRGRPAVGRTKPKSLSASFLPQRLRNRHPGSPSNRILPVQRTMGLTTAVYVPKHLAAVLEGPPQPLTGSNDRTLLTMRFPCVSPNNSPGIIVRFLFGIPCALA